MAFLAGCGDEGVTEPPPPSGPPDVALSEVVTGLDRPVHLTAPAGDSRIFIVEQPGRIVILEDGSMLATPYLDITDRVSSEGERGLLSLAFHPDFGDNGYLYVHYTDLAGDTRVERYQADPDADTVDPATATLVLSVEQPSPTHNGGLNLFGPDGMLYIGLGDGMDGDGRNAQDLSTLLGSILRIDVDGAQPYSIPPDNPFANGGGRPEVWAYGLRNPWRFSIDAQSGLLYVADVGQGAWEEVNVDAAEGGLNFGWNIMQATHCYNAPSCDMSGLVFPALEYSHAEGCSVIGGVVYRGDDIPSFVGHYVYADLCVGWIRSFRYDHGRLEDWTEWDVPNIGNIASFGTDAGGEIYVLTRDGAVYRIVQG